MKVKNNLLWRHPFAYGMSSYVIAMLLFYYVIKLSNPLLAVVASCFLAMAVDGYVRDNLFVWKCPKCGWKQEYKRYKHCIYCGTIMTAYRKEELKKRCIRCGKPIEDNWLYCANCGYMLKRAEEK